MKEAYFIDGDNVSSNDGLIFAKLSGVKIYIVTQRGTSRHYKNVLDIIRLKPSCIGKEASDMMIGMKVMQECCVNEIISRVGIVSNDGDMMDVIVNAAKEFPQIRFTLYHSTANTMSKKLRKAINSGNLPSNSNVQRYRSK
jgi:hypothetical protein